MDREEERRILEIQPLVALTIIAARGCERFTTGHCDPQDSPLAKYTAYQTCAPCVARIALEGRREE